MDTNEKQIVHVEQKNYEMPPRTGITVTHFLIVADIDRIGALVCKDLRRPHPQKRRQQRCSCCHSVCQYVASC